MSNERADGVLMEGDDSAVGSVVGSLPELAGSLEPKLLPLLRLGDA
jgi:hypothetical protein